VSFDNLIILDDKNRLFSAIVTAEIPDSQGDLIDVNEFEESFFKARVRNNGTIPISINHSNQFVGNWFDGERVVLSDGTRAYKAYGKVFASDPDVFEYDAVWEGMKQGVYSGTSIGGGLIERIPYKYKGRDVTKLSKIPLQEISLIGGYREDGTMRNPANPLALLQAMSLAKSDDLKKPGNVDELKWAEAKVKVKSEYPELNEDDSRFWKLTNSIYQNLIKTNEVDTMAEEPSKVIEEQTEAVAESKESSEIMKMLEKIYKAVYKEEDEKVEQEVSVDPEMEKEEPKEEVSETTNDEEPAVEDKGGEEAEPKVEPKDNEEIEKMKKEVDSLKKEIDVLKKSESKSTPMVLNKESLPKKSVWELEVERKLKVI